MLVSTNSNKGVAVLEVSGLTTLIPSRDGVVTPVDDVSFKVFPGQVMGLVGESGSGKSMTGYSIMGLIDKPGYVSAGSMLFTARDGKRVDLRGLSPSEMQVIRGDRIAMIFQDPMMTLNPVLRIDTQMVETVLAHRRVSKSEARERSRQALIKVGIASPDERLRSYPHQFSGGMRQRVAIAIALLNEPDLIIADEPTTALDVTIQAQILFEMQKLCTASGTALIWITHDLSVVAGLADTLSVMYAGKLVETGTVRELLEQPRHPYTAGLIACAPSRHKRGESLAQIPGMTPSLSALPSGCAFKTRCSLADHQCDRRPPLQLRSSGHAVRCFHSSELRTPA